MQIAVTFRHIEPNEGMKDYVKEKVEKLEKYLDNPREIHVVLSSEKFRHIAEITVISDGMTLNSQGRDTDLYAAVDQMVDKIERQVRERRGKVKRKRGTAPSVPSAQEEEGSAEVKTETPSVIQRRRTLVKAGSAPGGLFCFYQSRLRADQRSLPSEGRRTRMGRTFTEIVLIFPEEENEDHDVCNGRSGDIRPPRGR
jgi:putative sigma-54 modulation protein